MPPADETMEQPAKNGTKADWTAYALSGGKTEEDLDGLTRDEIAALFDEDQGTDPEAAKEAAYEAGEAMTAPGANPLMSAGAETLPPHLRAAAVHRELE